MADINRIRKRKAVPSKQHAIRTAEIFNFGVDGNPSVIMINKRTVNNAAAKSTARELEDYAKSSPWSEDKLVGALARQSNKTSVDSDPVKELKNFVAALEKG